MRATIVNCTLKASPEKSNTEALASVVTDALESEDVECEWFRLADMSIPPGVESDLGEGDDWPRVRESIVGSEILILATPTWVGLQSSLAQRAVERLDALLSETDDEGRPIAYNRVAGVVVTGNADGAHGVIYTLLGALGNIGFTIPGQSWTYWNLGPGPGPEYSETDEGHDWSHSTGRAMASNLLAGAQALEANPIPAPPE